MINDEQRELIHGGDIYSVFEMDPSAKDVLVDFSANISPLGMPDFVSEAVIRELCGAAHYPDPKARRLKDAITGAFWKLYDTQLLREWIFCGNGAADVIYRWVLAKKPKRALVCAPTFAEYEEALALSGAKLEFYMCPGESLEVREDILEALHPGLDGMFLCNPNNPTGLLIAPGLLEQIIVKTKEMGVFLVMDECFLDFVDNEKKFSVIPRLSHNKHILVLKSFTKMYGMAGLRLGYGLCADPALIQAMERCGQPWPVSTAAESAGVAALSDLKYPETVRRVVDQERNYLMDAFSALGIHFWNSQANYILIELPHLADFYDQMLAEGILVRRCANYRNLSSGHYRVAVNSHENNVRLTAALEKILGNTLRVFNYGVEGTPSRGNTLRVYHYGVKSTPNRGKE